MDKVAALGRAKKSLEAEGPEQEAEGPEQEAEGPEQEAEGRRDHRLANGIIWVNR